MAAKPSVAVVVERANKYYGNPDKPDFKPVLTNLNMTVEKGIIYGLLGPSGCGKTTLLSCIVGRRRLDSGDVYVLGGRPGEKGSGIPGPRVGYMPQEIALVGEFTVRDAIYYFGRIYGMTNEKLAERFDFLSSLLELSHPGKLVKNLSGGQQRRVSLAAALVHEPELLILDEPCVGLDPILRERIWEFMSEVARGGTTIIITTHYIDETKQAHKIGLLRDGYLLAEDPPEDIMRKFNSDTLEDAFLKLALRQHETMPAQRSALTPDVIPSGGVSVMDSRHSSQEFSVITSSTDILTKKDNPKNGSSNLSRSRYRAVFIKTLQQFSRNPGGLIFSVLFPIVQAVAFFAAVGHDPRDLHLAVVNDEAKYSGFGAEICRNSSLNHVIRVDDEVCELYMLSCWFLEELEKVGIYQTPYDSVVDTKQAIERGSLYGGVAIPRNFSAALERRVREGDVPDDVLDDSTVSVWLDSSNHQISYFIKGKLHKAYEGFTRRCMHACNRPENMVQIPVLFHTPVYGRADSQFMQFMAPGVMITIVFFLAAIVTSTLMISDRLEGVWERSAVAGVKPYEMLNAHIVIQAIVILVQTLEMLALGFAGYGLPAEGSLVTCGFLLFLQGLSGMCYGFLLSVCCNSYTLSFFIATGSFYPMIMLCGIVWPLEGMTKGLRMIALTLPFTIPSKSLRDIMEKGYSITHAGVYQGFLVTVAWIVVTISLCYVRLRWRKL